jgi:hypothetical protein
VSSNQSARFSLFAGQVGARSATIHLKPTTTHPHLAVLVIILAILVIAVLVIVLAILVIVLQKPEQKELRLRGGHNRLQNPGTSEIHCTQQKPLTLPYLSYELYLS